MAVATAAVEAQQSERPQTGPGAIVDAETGREIPRIPNIGLHPYAVISVEWVIVNGQTGARRRLVERWAVDASFWIPEPDLPEGWRFANKSQPRVRVHIAGYAHPGVTWEPRGVTVALKKLPETRDAVRRQLGEWRAEIDAALAGKAGEEEAMRAQRALLWYLHFHCGRLSLDTRAGICYEPGSPVERYARELTRKDVFAPLPKPAAAPPSAAGPNLAQGVGSAISATSQDPDQRFDYERQHVPVRAGGPVRGSYQVRRVKRASAPAPVQAHSPRDLRFVPDPYMRTFPAGPEKPPDAPTAAGRARDAAALGRMAFAGDVAAIQSFWVAMQQMGIASLPPDVEAVVERFFNDATAGPALRAMGPYRSQALFELHLKRVKSAYVANESSYHAIMATDLPGIEARLLEFVDKVPSYGPVHPYVAFAARRRHPAAVPHLIAAIQAFYAQPDAATRYNEPLALLLRYPSEDVWRKARAEIERLQTSGAIAQASRDQALAKIDPQLAEPAKWMEDIAQHVAGERLARLTRDLPASGDLRELRARDAKAYATTLRGSIEQYERAAAEVGARRAPYIASQWLHLGLHLRFKLGDAKAAIDPLTRAARLEHPLAAIALGDTYQIDMREASNAARWYRVALERHESAGPTDGSQDYGPEGRPANAWWRVWLRHEIDLLERGREFDGEIDEGPLLGTFIAMRGMLADVQRAITPDAHSIAKPVVPTVGANPRSWESQERPLPRDHWEPTMQPLPPSRLSLLFGLREISRLQDPGEILREFERHDPSGFWSTCIFAAVAYYDGMGEAGRPEATTLRAIQMLPGWRLEKKDGPMSQAAERFLRERGLAIQAYKGAP